MIARLWAPSDGTRLLDINAARDAMCVYSTLDQDERRPSAALKEGWKTVNL